MLLFNRYDPVMLLRSFALGDINDPEFGHTHANTDFNITPVLVGQLSFRKE